MTSRELIHATLEFRNKDGRVPRDLWTLPWAESHCAEGLAKIRNDFPADTKDVYITVKPSPIEKGNAYKVGEYIDPWGCRFQNIHEGVIGEVKDPLVEDDDWEDADKITIPYHWLDFDINEVNAGCRNTDKFVFSGCCPRPFEQLQFIRGTANLFCDLLDRPSNMIRFMEKMHTFYCDLMEKWGKTEVDGLRFMDDWGSQRSLLIDPGLWDEIFLPMYRDYIDIAKRYHKKSFMHSDGHTLAIIPRLIDLGLDAINTQIFCVGPEKLEQFKGKITFWGEIDRQHLLVDASVPAVEAAVRDVKDRLWADGGCVAQCEFGPGGKPENVYAVYKTWQEIV